MGAATTNIGRWEHRLPQTPRKRSLRLRTHDARMSEENIPFLLALLLYSTQDQVLDKTTSGRSRSWRAR